ncbi:DUF3868 domain-containing protein [Bacteroides sp.]
MKRSLIHLLLLLLLPAVTATAQEAYKGQIRVTQKHFTLSGGQLQVNMEVNYEGLELPASESLTLTPILKASTQHRLVLPSVLINGSGKQRVYNRQQKLASKGAKSAASSTTPSVVLNNNAKGARRFVYRVSVPYKEWMPEAVLFLQSEECGCNGKKARAFEDKIADNVIPQVEKKPQVERGIDYRFLSKVNFLTPMPGDKKLRYVQGSISISEQRFSEDKQNYEIYYRLREALSSVLEQNGTELAHVQLTGFGAPSGNLRKNEKEAATRALSLKKFLIDNKAVGKTSLDVNWIAEDWDSVTNIVKRSDMLFREAVLDIISSVEISNGRERMLMNLADGVPYRYLSERVFPFVRRVDYRISYTRRPIDASEGRRMLAAGSNSLSLNEFFAVANSYPKGSAEYNDALDLAARLFPDSPEANINAAAVALSKRDAKRARHYLERFATLPAAYNNMGILYLLEGNRDKAEVYLQMAAANGVTQAQEALLDLK